MSDRRDSWQDTFRALGQAMIEVLRAEWVVIQEVWGRSAQELGKALGLFAAVAYLGLICLPGLLIFALVMGLHSGLGLPLWGAALIVAALVVLVGYVLVRLSQRLLRRGFENPVATVETRIADHRAWWNERILSDGTTKGDADAVGEADAAFDEGERPPGEPPAGV